MAWHRRRFSTAIERLEPRLCLAATITINTSQTAQTIQALGGNYAIGKFGSSTKPVNDSVGTYTLANLAPKETRIGIPLDAWEPTNDNPDPNNINFADFATTATGVTNVFQLMQSLKAEGAAIVGTVWDVPNWMVSDPNDTNSRLVPASMYPDMIESIAAFLIRADTVYNVRVDYLSINEPDGGNQLSFTSAQEADFIAEAGPAFAQLGLAYTPKFLVGDTDNPSHLVAFATPILADAAAAPYLGPISYHAWGSLGYAASVFSGIVTLADQYDKPIWCTELGYDPFAFNESPAPFPTWTFAIDTAETYYISLKLAQTSVDLYWEMQNDYALLSTNPTVLYPSYYVIQTLMQNFVPGSEMVAANSSTAPVESMAAKDPATGRLAIELINTGVTTTQTVTVTGLPAGLAMTQIRSDATENAVNEGTLTANSNGTFTFSLPPQTVSTLTGFIATSAGPALVTASQHIYALSPNQVQFTFNIDVGASAFNLASLTIAGAGVPPITPTAFSYDPTSHTATWTLPPTIADGTYTATLAAGTVLSQNATLNFFSLLGDANHDGVVNAPTTTSWPPTSTSPA